MSFIIRKEDFISDFIVYNYKRAIFIFISFICRIWIYGGFNEELKISLDKLAKLI